MNHLYSCLNPCELSVYVNTTTSSIVSLLLWGIVQTLFGNVVLPLVQSTSLCLEDIVNVESYVESTMLSNI